MGLCETEIYFEDSIPSMEKIKNKFEDLTGLPIYITARLDMINLPTSTRQVLEVLSSDIDKHEKWKEKREEEWKEKGWSEIKIDCNYIGGFCFSSSGFDDIDFNVSGNYIELYSYVNNFYFIESLTKTFYELGGKFINSNGKIEERQSLAIWKKLKKWEDYKWYNRPGK